MVFTSNLRGVQKEPVTISAPTHLNIIHTVWHPFLTLASIANLCFSDGFQEMEEQFNSILLKILLNCSRNSVQSVKPANRRRIIWNCRTIRNEVIQVLGKYDPKGEVKDVWDLKILSLWTKQRYSETLFFSPTRVSHSWSLCNKTSLAGDKFILRSMWVLGHATGAILCK